jgi:hypothetical protein
VYADIALEAVALDTPNNIAVYVTDAPAKRTRHFPNMKQDPRQSVRSFAMFPKPSTDGVISLWRIFLDIQCFFEILGFSVIFTQVLQTEVYSMQFTSSFIITEMSYSHDKRINLRCLWRMSVLIFKRHEMSALGSF